MNRREIWMRVPPPVVGELLLEMQREEKNHSRRRYPQ